jgi:hypothetical protein
MMAWKRLPHHRPNVLYVTGEKSALSHSGHLRRAAEMTGTGIRGNGGIDNGRVQHVPLDSGHYMPFKEYAVEEAAAAVGNWTVEE